MPECKQNHGFAIKPDYLTSITEYRIRIHERHYNVCRVFIISNAEINQFNSVFVKQLNEMEYGLSGWMAGWLDGEMSYKCK